MPNKIDLNKYENQLHHYLSPYRNSKPLEDKSIDSYLRNAKIINKYINDPTEIDDVIEYLHSNDFKNSTRLNYINTLINYMYINKLPHDHFIQYRDDVIKKKIKDPPNPKKEENIVEWTDILKWRDAIINHNFSLKLAPIDEIPNVSQVVLQEELLLRLFTTYQRRNELCELVYMNSNSYHPGQNVLFHDLKQNKIWLIFSDYKTKDTYGVQQIEVVDTEENKNLKTFLLNFINHLENPHVFCLPTQPSKQLDRLNLTKLLSRSSKKYLNKTISTNMIRKSYNTTKYKNIKKELLNDSLKNAHQPSTIINSYTNI